MPLSLVPKMVLRETRRPWASNETIAVVADLVMMLPLTSPETFSNQMPLPPLPVISQSVTRMSRPPRQCIRPRRVGRGIPPPSSVILARPMLPAPSPDTIDAPPVKTSLVAPRTPTSCVPFCKLSIPVR